MTVSAIVTAMLGTERNLTSETRQKTHVTYVCNTFVSSPRLRRYRFAMTAIILTASIAGLIWGLILATRGSLVLGCVLYLMIACVLGPNFLSFDVAGITLSLDRVFLVGLVGAYILRRELGETDPKPISKTDLVLFAFMGVLGISTFTHDYHVYTKNDVPIVQHLLNGYLIPLVIYWIVRQSRLDDRELTRVLAALTIFGLYLAVTGILEAFQQWSLVFPKYIADPKLGLHFGRARGPMVHSVSYGLYLDTCLLALGLWMSKVKHRRLQIALGALIPVFLAAVFFTKTRTVWLGAGTGTLIVLGIVLHGKTRVAVLGTAVLAGLLVGVAKSDAILGLQREGTVQDTRESAQMRKVFTYVSWKMFLDRPLWGFGFGHFAHEKLNYLSDRSTELRLESIRDYVHHNTFLSVLTETGLIGLSLLIAVLAGWGRTAWKLARNVRAPDWMCRHGLLTLGMLGIAVWQMIGHEITFTTLDQSLIYCICGLAVGLQAMLRREGELVPVSYTPYWPQANAPLTRRA